MDGEFSSFLVLCTNYDIFKQNSRDFMEGVKIFFDFDLEGCRKSYEKHQFENHTQTAFESAFLEYEKNQT